MPGTDYLALFMGEPRSDDVVEFFIGGWWPTPSSPSLLSGLRGRDSL